MELVDFIIIAICGLGIGMLSGMFGIGGGTMIVPLLYIAFGLPIVGATSTSLLTIAPTGISGSIKHYRQKTLALKTGLIIGGFGAVASVAGSFVAASVPSYITVILSAAVILFSAALMLRTVLISKKSAKKADAEKAAGQSASCEEATRTVSKEAVTVESRKKKSRLHVLILPALGLIAGGIAGIVGVGGGFLIVPVCVAYLGFSFKKAAGTSLVSIALIAIPGIISHALLGHIWWLYGLAIILGTIPGAQIGSWLITKLPEQPMRIAFIVLLALAGALMVVQEFFLVA